MDSYESSLFSVLNRKGTLTSLWKILLNVLHNHYDRVLIKITPISRSDLLRIEIKDHTIKW